MLNRSKVTCSQEAQSGKPVVRDNPQPKVFIAGRVTKDALEGSYLRAFQKLGLTVTSWDMPKALVGRTRLGPIGRFVNGFWPVEVWVMKANRDLLLAVLKSSPDLLLVFGGSSVSGGVLGQIKAALPQCQIVLIWPDSLLYCYSWVLDAIPAYDLIATYSRATVDPFLRLGARRAAWVPLGFDPELHSPYPDENQNSRAVVYANCDASFVGSYTPEREEIVVQLVSAGLRVRVWGSRDWERAARDRAALKKYWQGGPLFGKDFCLAVRSAPVSLNPINPVTYPAANMRFFEIPGCGGVSVCAKSPELEAEFPDRQACYYYDSPADAARVVRMALDDPEGRKRVSRAGQEIVLGAHTYVHRAQQILELVNLRQAAHPAVIGGLSFSPANPANRSPASPSPANLNAFHPNRL
jgi:spore maturation protein CgeB